MLMAKFSISSLNYVTVGQNRAFINVDTTSENGLNQSYVVEFANDPKNKIDIQNRFAFTPMYDIKDVMFRFNSDVDRTNPNQVIEGTRRNIFLPDMEAHPVGFCQQVANGKTNTFIATKPTTNDVYMYQSSLLKTRERKEVSKVTTM